MESGKGRVGDAFAEFLDEQGIREEVEGQAIKELIAEQIGASSACRSCRGSIRVYVELRPE